MKPLNSIIIVDDNRSVRTAIALLLQTIAEKVIPVSSPVTLPRLIAEERPSCIVLDMNFLSGTTNGNEGIFWLNEILRLSPGMPVILMTAYADIDLAIKGIKAGAADFIIKPWDNSRLLQAIMYAAGKKTGKQKEKASNDFSPFFGNSPRMAALRDIVDKVAPTDASILITGENGTGKSMLAKYIHHRSGRSAIPMVHADMGAITDTLFESEFFGHEKNAFTGASSTRKGRFEIAHGSTLFLDEVANIPLSIQSKLLCAIQEKRITRVGSNHPIDVNVRLISATSSDPESLVERGLFRRDLLWRINTIHLHLPPLRERREDIIPLARIFISAFCEKYNRPELTLSPECHDLLMSAAFPGNIRQLEHLIEKAVILADGDTITHEQFAELSCQPVHAETSIPVTLDEMERKMIADSIQQCESNLSQAAARLGITRQTLYNKIKKYGL